MARSAQVLAFSLGVAGEHSVLMRSGNIQKSEMAGLLRAGAVGDVLGRFLDAEGRSIDHPIDTRTIGVDLETVRSIPEKILAAAGTHKVAIIRAAAKRGLVDTLITDDVTAELIVSETVKETVPSEALAN